MDIPRNNTIIKVAMMISYQLFFSFAHPRQGLEPGSHNVQSRPLVEPNKTLLPPLHIKLGLMKNSVKSMDRKG